MWQSCHTDVCIVKAVCQHTYYSIRNYRPGCRLEDNFRIDIEEVGWEGLDWIHLAQGRDQ
jgi:hypothetical protein